MSTVVFAHRVPAACCMACQRPFCEILDDMEVRREREIKIEQPAVSFGQRRFCKLGVALEHTECIGNSYVTLQVRLLFNRWISQVVVHETAFG